MPVRETIIVKFRAPHGACSIALRGGGAEPACWAPPVWDALPAGYHLVIRWWIARGVGAFAAVLGLFALIVFRPGL